VTADSLAFLHATLDAAQARAEAAGGDEWTQQDHPSDSIAIYDSKREPVVYDEGWPSPEQAAHIVANNPAAVLRRIAADRKLIAAHPITSDVRDIRIISLGCRTCHRWDDQIDGRGYCDSIIALAEGWGWTDEAT
jgi:hypothetical protein